MASPCAAIPGQIAFKKFWTYKRTPCAPFSGGCGDDCAQPGFQLNKAAGSALTIDTSDRARSIATFILMTRAAQDNASCRGRPERYGGYWADSFRLDNLKSGSRIYYVPLNASISSTVNAVVAFAQDDMQKMVSMNEADAVFVSGKYAGNGVISLTITITVDGQNIDVPFAATRSTGNQWVFSS